MTKNSKRILLIISGSVAAYKGLELARELTRRGYKVPAILTEGGQQFITPLAISSLTAEPVYTELFSLKDEIEMGHIRLSREADLIVVAPASADIIASIAHGNARDLATATLLAADKQVMVAPAMNVKMWENPATRRNVKQLLDDGIKIIGPDSGSLACGEQGSGRMSDVELIITEIEYALNQKNSLTGVKALVTAGPTYEPIDPVRFIGNFSSGKQGYAIAEVLKKNGANVTLISGPTNLPDINGVKMLRVTTADEMQAAVNKTFPVELAIFSAAVADWKPAKTSNEKIKKMGGSSPTIELEENPDILQVVGNLPKNKRPKLVVGFAAESENLLDNARIKLAKKGADIIIANDIKANNIFGNNLTKVVIVTSAGSEELPYMSKTEVALKLTEIISNKIQNREKENA